MTQQPMGANAEVKRISSLLDTASLELCEATRLEYIATMRLAKAKQKHAELLSQLTAMADGRWP